MKYSEPNYGLHLSHAQPYCALYKFYKFDKHFFNIVSSGEQKVDGLCSKRKSARDPASRLQNSNQPNEMVRNLGP